MIKFEGEGLKSMYNIRDLVFPPVPYGCVEFLYCKTDKNSGVITENVIA